MKAHVHVRINVCGSPLECPGMPFTCDILIYQPFVLEPLCIFVRFMTCVETFPSIGRVRVKHRGILLTLKGTVIRSGAIKMIEGEKIYECRVCKLRSNLCAFICSIALRQFIEQKNGSKSWESYLI